MAAGPLVRPRRRTQRTRSGEAIRGDLQHRGPCEFGTARGWIDVNTEAPQSWLDGCQEPRQRRSIIITGGTCDISNVSRHRRTRQEAYRIHHRDGPTRLITQSRAACDHILHYVVVRRTSDSGSVARVGDCSD